MADSSLRRALRALAREGLLVRRDGPIFHVRRAESPEAPEAAVLLPEGFPLEGRAFAQLADFAAVRHPAGGRVCRACATPDFHPGEHAPVGAVVATSPDLVVPQAIGTDINCGMRLHVTDLDGETFRAGQAELVRRLTGDLLLGTRDLPMRGSAMRAAFAGGLGPWLQATRPEPLGALGRSDLGQIEAERGRVYLEGAFDGDPTWAPPDRLGAPDDLLRDDHLATVGGGNHFVEFQVVDQIQGRHRAWDWGVKLGQVAFMIHAGSRGVGQHVGKRWMEKARELWPPGHRHPRSGLFGLFGEPAAAYLRAMNAAANYGFLNRLLLAELVRLRLREVFGPSVEAPLVYDVPHNVILREGDENVHRKGATPAHEGQPVLVPGSMGHPSFLLEGRGEPRMIASASHGAGRATTRFEMGRAGAKARDEASLGLVGVQCITLRPERRIEEAPAAYKPIGPVVESQVQMGVVAPVARLAPLLTFKA